VKQHGAEPDGLTFAVIGLIALSCIAFGFVLYIAVLA